MKSVCLVLAALVVLTSAKNLEFMSELELQAFDEVITLFEHIQKYGQISFGEEGSAHKASKSHRLGTFKFENCLDPSQEIMVPSNVSVTPDPVKIPGSITASGNVLIKSEFGSPAPMQIKIWKEVFGAWIPIPCIDNFGSCTYEDFCTILAPATCPPEFVKIGLSCKCPFKPGNFKVPPVTIDITQSLPVKITGGVRARLQGTYQSQNTTCVQIELTLG